jgi:hypothetical protein
MLFLLDIEPLHKMLQHAQNLGALNTLHKTCARFRVSLYADDATIFINPTAQELNTTKPILLIFGDATGLITNMEKTEIYPIRCQQISLYQVLDPGQQASSFPCTYLGLPLHYKKLPKSAIQPLVQKIGHKLPG